MLIPTEQSLEYRPEIDGLRAVAVIPVILFHAGFSAFSGGYVGVDVFFVISGFLITSILVRDLEKGRFSIAHFYERRARRILPALVVVMAACIPFAWLWMLPSELVSFGKSVAATSLFGSNILFWTEANYFAPDTDLKPLLHTWSLAVEEQYYLLFPIYLFFAWKLGRNFIFWSLIAFVGASFAMAQWGVVVMPTAAFFLAPTRVWEILLGAVCAVVAIRADLRSQWLSFAGLAMVLYAIFGFEPDTPTPSLWTAVPVVGTALILLSAKSGTAVASILQWRPFVFVGLVSYSAYLWHQPILAFARIRLAGHLPEWLVLALIALTLLLAWLSWRYIEAPFREKLWKRRGIFAASIVLILVFTGIGLALATSGGADWRTAPSGKRYADMAMVTETLAPNYGLDRACDSNSPPPIRACSTSGTPEAVLWGDSYAMHLAPALNSSPTKLSFVQATLSQCGPIPGLAVQGTLTPWKTCMGFNKAVLGWILAQDTVKTVIISSPFVQSEIKLYREDGSTIDDTPARRAAIVSAIHNLDQTLAKLGKRLVVVSPPAQNGADLGICHVRAATLGYRSGNCDFKLEAFLKFRAPTITLLKEIEKQVPVVWLPDLTCHFGICSTDFAGIPLYRDDGHFSRDGSNLFGEKFDLAQVVLAASRPR